MAADREDSGRTLARVLVPSRKLSPAGRPFLVAVALCMAMTALSIDMLLPAFPELRAHVGMAEGSTEIAQVVTFYFIGLASGQIVFGTLSDRYGRLPLLRIGLAVMVLGAIATTLMGSLTGLIIGRLVWGFGGAAPRTISLAMVRDRMHGDQMAKTMSMLMSIFLLVPVLAPGLGALVLELGDWRLLIGIQALFIFAILVWTFWMPETLDPANRRSTSLPSILRAGRFVLTNRVAMSFALASTVLFGSIATYIGTAEVIFEEVFDAKTLFPVMFGVIAVAMAAGSLSGSKIVGRVGMLGVLRGAGIGAGVSATLLLVLALVTGGSPPMWTFVVAMSLLLAGYSLLTPSCNTAAMGPLGHIAGLGAAITGMISTAGGALLGGVADRTYDGTIVPFAIAVAVFTAMALACVVVGLRDPSMRSVDISATTAIAAAD